MAFWCRLIAGDRRLRSLLPRLCTRWVHLAEGGGRVRHLEQSFLGGGPLSRSAIAQFTPVRGIKNAREKVREKESSGPRINEEIDAGYVRLVTDEGHAIVSRREALDRARRLDLDLVEVQRESDPPVCKIMDLYKEKFKKQAIMKERAKTKGDTTLRKGDYKEVKFTGKIENKDLQLKAETVKRLMERGYRVKVIAEAGKQSGSSNAGNEDLNKVLSRLYNLIEDVSALESPPLVKEKMAYLIVRHAKFGSKKNPPKKATEVDESNGSDAEKTRSNLPLPVDNAFRQTTKVVRTSEPGLEIEQVHVTPPYSHTSQVPRMGNRNFDSGRTDVRIGGSGIGRVNANSAIEHRNGNIPHVSNSVKTVPSPEISNRYSKTGPSRNTPFRTPTQPSFFKVRDEGLRNMKEPYSHLGDCHPSGGSLSRPPMERKDNYGDSRRKHEQSSPGSASPRTNFGVFSNRNTPATSTQTPDLKQKVSGSSVPEATDSQAKDDTRPREDDTRPRDWGIFSR